ncbi:MAG TPA: hypothetical protein ENJ37_06585 [Deltaproteobacteria bacterium]|nr:hypothetical protein [Deltaproteobacteria bacterium]
MKRVLLVLAFLVTAACVLPASAFPAEDVYYARCNLKVVKGRLISWVNWQAAREMIPAGTKLLVSYDGGDEAEIEDPATGRVYRLLLGAEGRPYLEKFVVREPVTVVPSSPEIAAEMKKGLIAVGMTKLEAYTAMGPPANADMVNTDTMTYDEIMEADLWVYKRKRFGKNIGVAFDPDTGLVTRTEGIWRRQ